MPPTSPPLTSSSYMCDTTGNEGEKLLSTSGLETATAYQGQGYMQIGAQPTCNDEAIDHGEVADTFSSERAEPHGLGIGRSRPSLSSISRRASTQSAFRVPLESEGGSRRETASNSFVASSANAPTQFPLYSQIPSPASAGFDAQGGPNSYENSPCSVSSVHSDLDQPYHHCSQTEVLTKEGPNPSVRSIRSAYDDQSFVPQTACPTNRHFFKARQNYLAITILVCSIFSTVFSLIFLVLALIAPRYGRHVGSFSGAISPSNAILLTSVMAKLIELSFVTSVVAFLGQALSRRAMNKNGGVSIAELSMRNWIMQPGTLMTHAAGLRYAGRTILGGLSLLAVAVSMFYTAAASALVQPHLRYGDYQAALMVGDVYSSWANPTYLAQQCSTPITASMDAYSGTTCLQIEHAAQGYHNYQRYLSYWEELAGSGVGTTDQKQRPPGFGIFHEDTLINASWVETVDTNQVSQLYKRIINNVSLAMPHAGIYQAARHPDNHIMQPEDLDGQGQYSLHASVPSPVVNVMCANMEAEELAPLVYEMWPNAVTPVNLTWETTYAQSHNNRTVVDSLFGWNVSSDAPAQRPPTFAKLPHEYNTILNHTAWAYGRSSIYLLGRGGGALRDIYVLCALKASLTPFCSTRYNATANGSSMEAICEVPGDSLSYNNSLPDATSGAAAVSDDWFNVASEWGNSLSLHAGINDNNASNARLLTQYILSGDYEEAKLNPALPSVAEALAVLSGCTLLQSTENTPFVTFWNYTTTILDEPQQQYFNASLRTLSYSSGPSNEANKAFFPILFLAFVINLFVLIYLLVQGGLVTDFSEPPNLFSLAVNSPPSRALAGSCGAGPTGPQWGVPFGVAMIGEHFFVADKADRGVVVDEASREEKEQDGGARVEPSPGDGWWAGWRRMWHGRPRRRRGWSTGRSEAAESVPMSGSTAYDGPASAMASPVLSRYDAGESRLPTWQSCARSPDAATLVNRDSPIVRMYSKFSKRRSFL